MAGAITRTDDDTIGGRIQRVRGSLGLSTGDLAARIGVKPETMRGWERDRAEPRANKLIRLADVLGVSPAWLMGGYGRTLDGVELDRAAIAVKLEALRARRDSIDREIQELEMLAAQAAAA